jgi:hypothetical protein
LTYLFDLVRLGSVSSRLQVDDLGDPIASENVMIAAYPLLKTKSAKQSTQVAEMNAGIRRAS